MLQASLKELYRQQQTVTQTFQKIQVSKQAGFDAGVLQETPRIRDFIIIYNCFLSSG